MMLSGDDVANGIIVIIIKNTEDSEGIVVAVDLEFLMPSFSFFFFCLIFFFFFPRKVVEVSRVCNEMVH